MRDDDLTAVLDRLDRIARALDVGCTSLGHTYRDEVARVLLETCWEGIALAHGLTLEVAYHDLFGDIDALCAVWAQVAEQTAQVHAVEPAARDAVDTCRTTAAAVEALRAGASAVDDAQLQVTARPRDRHAARDATIAIRRLEATADCLFVDALADDRHGRLDAAMAVLTTVAARAARERAAVARRG
ncbi:hypothetical protein [Euzebya sp.]|uniref:hypothetical protein n=1 Tax=Euzebya sp. TaxID=1971409 RepID=UPI003515B615